MDSELPEPENFPKNDPSTLAFVDLTEKYESDEETR